ncbi:Beta-1,2-xylosyltransferase [Drechslerella dactyloides]|uniref:Beta-1,2-xylosyltransferase n=1 Tax=Drechslerella dactyloides TaxID=74499 RepID=A0AAD6IYS6_DREDA|nr:Beta-1,2-xylosyltransferase [Drechslerella dactyloides]
MSGILNTHLLSSISSTSPLSADGTARLIANVFLTGLVTGIYTPGLHSLLVSAVSWCTVAIVLFMVQKQSMRDGEAQGAAVDRKTKRKVTALIACILLSGVCERVVGPDWEVKTKAAWWNKAGLPLVTRFLRNYLLGEPGILEGSARGSKRLLALISTVAFLTLAPRAIPDSNMALGLANIAFQSMTYVLLEDIALGSGRDNKNIPGVPAPDVRSLANGGYLRTAVGATVGLVLLAAYFEKPLDDYALKANPGYSLIKILAMGTLGGFRWLCLPLLVSRLSSPSGSLVDLAVTLIASQWALSTSPFQFLGTVGTLILISFHFVAPPGGRDGRLSQVLGPTRVTIASLFIFLIITSVMVSTMPAQPSKVAFTESSPPPQPISTAPPSHVHPIKHLMDKGAKDFEDMKQRQSTSLNDAVKNYWKRYKMPPPPNFDKWYEFAVAHDSALIDEYDMIYHQIRPFWGMPAKMVRDRAREALGFKQAFMTLSIRKGKVIDVHDAEDWQRHATVGMLASFKKWIPDMDLAFNLHDEPRVVTPAEDMAIFLARFRNIDWLESPKNKFTGFPKSEKGKVEATDDTRFNEFAHQPIWGNSKLSCPPGTPARDPLEKTPDAVDQYAMSPIGFIFNRTAFTDVCLQPSVRYRHGFFQRPNAYHVAHALFPIFSQSSVSCYNDIIYPSPWYWAGKVTYQEKRDKPWEEKRDLLYWRGSTTGGFSRLSGWKHQHRQRVVRHLNAGKSTSYTLESSGSGESTKWKLKTTRRSELKELIDVNFSHIGQCDDADCEEQKTFFKPGERVEQQDAWNYKYLLDMDGNAFSGRFYAFLQSHSAVFKMALFREWHEEWLVPWVHYVPLTLDMGESVEVLRYFTREKEGAEAIRKIAEQGRYWARKVLRKEDFEVWFFRLLLEYGRVIDDNREIIGFDV